MKNFVNESSSGFFQSFLNWTHFDKQLRFYSVFYNDRSRNITSSNLKLSLACFANFDFHIIKKTVSSKGGESLAYDYVVLLI